MSLNNLMQSESTNLFDLSNNQIIALLLILLFGFFLRLGMIDMAEETVPLRNDAMEYYSYAMNMKESGIYSMKMPKSLSESESALVSDATRPPGYPLFLLSFVESPPTIEMIHNIRFAQVLISTLSILLSFILFKPLFNNNIALFSTFLVALSPHLISMNFYILTESFFTFFLMLFAILLSHAASRKSVLNFILAGCTLGILVLIKPSISLFTYFFIVFYLIQHHDKKSMISLTGFMLACLLIQSPWIIYSKSIDPEANEKSKSLVSLQNGSYPGLMYNDIIETRSLPHRADPNYDNIVTYSDFAEDLKNKVKEDPAKYFKWYFFEKFLMMYSWDTVAGAGDIFVYPVGYSPYLDRQPFKITHQFMKGIHNPLMALSFLSMCLFFITGSKIRRESKQEISVYIISLLSIYFVSLHILVTPLPRYMIPLRPLSIGLAVYLVIYIASYGRSTLLRFRQKT